MEHVAKPIVGQPAPVTSTKELVEPTDTFGKPEPKDPNTITNEAKLKNDNPVQYQFDNMPMSDQPMVKLVADSLGLTRSQMDQNLNELGAITLLSMEYLHQFFGDPSPEMLRQFLIREFSNLPQNFSNPVNTILKNLQKRKAS